MGRSLQNSLINLGIENKYQEALLDLGYVLEDIYEEVIVVCELDLQEKDAALGNGGLGRLAACYLDSMATQNIPATGYGIRYNYGIFQQEISQEGYQIERPEYWLTFGSPWEIEREDIQFEVQFYGSVVETKDAYGNKTVAPSCPSYVQRVWRDTQKVMAQAYDAPINGYDTNTTIGLRLWKALPFSVRVQ